MTKFKHKKHELSVAAKLVPHDQLLLFAVAVAQTTRSKETEEALTLLSQLPDPPMTNDEYERQERPLLEEYERQVQPLREEYNRQQRPLLEEYRRQERPLWEEHRRQREPLLEEYNRQASLIIETTDAIGEGDPMTHTKPKHYKHELSVAAKLVPYDQLLLFATAVAQTTRSKETEEALTLLSQLPDPPMTREEYARQEQPLLEEYRRQREPLWEEYRRQERPLWEEYARQQQLLREEYARQQQPLWEEYECQRRLIVNTMNVIEAAIQ